MRARQVLYRWASFNSDVVILISWNFIWCFLLSSVYLGIFTFLLKYRGTLKSSQSWWYTAGGIIMTQGERGHHNKKGFWWSFLHLGHLCIWACGLIFLQCTTFTASLIPNSSLLSMNCCERHCAGFAASLREPLSWQVLLLVNTDTQAVGKLCTGKLTTPFTSSRPCSEARTPWSLSSTSDNRNPYFQITASFLALCSFQFSSQALHSHILPTFSNGVQPRPPRDPHSTFYIWGVLTTSGLSHPSSPALWSVSLDVRLWCSWFPPHPQQGQVRSR